MSPRARGRAKRSNDYGGARTRGPNSSSKCEAFKLEMEDSSSGPSSISQSQIGRSSEFGSQRRDSCANISDFEICNKYDIDNTGLVCPWPSEEILSYYCLSHADMFRSKRIIELGAGYGLAGLVIATVSEASEVVISDGNPRVVDCILLTCTFFKEVHKGLVRTVNFLLKGSGPSEAIFFSPKRGDSLDKFLEEVEESGLHFSLSEKYDERIWKRHQELSKGDESWPNYDADHCYPLLLKISR
ncbi:hypothetical protein Cgig2_019588 [Carnegiea gigantea]|uniref:Calmodulin-lysine N-methyltransferase n=1 Tax=Carnegiea gigantea TaxID=171969 RepID=A0A9Q1KG30_9CARY|nr:hypothetical protein Cgig2_019588 [Carnegiea gigantea]